MRFLDQADFKTFPKDKNFRKMLDTFIYFTCHYFVRYKYIYWLKEVAHMNIHQSLWEI